jgi:sarcosine/dimethylglycine N-methyltransferase
MNPLDVRSTDKYKEEYIHSFVEKWDQLIDWERRAKAEGEFFIETLRSYGAKKVLDVATGTGFHSILLRKAGFEVTSVDGSPVMLSKAFDNARRHGELLRVVHADWRWLNRDVHDLYDAVICLGNSFTHLHSDHDRRKVLAEYYATLRHDGILILDQRNYDAILDHDIQPTHNYYYCGEEVRAAPEHVDETLARFRYEFNDGSVFHLNMFPLRKRYVQRLMKEVGFQRVRTYGDFKETYRETEPDFFIHVAEKTYITPEEAKAESMRTGQGYTGVVEVARDYYNSDDADNFYFHVWGGEDIHVGLYEKPDDDIAAASRRTVERLAQKIPDLDESTRVLDIGAGYGGAARYLARHFGCHVTALNLSEKENERNREYNMISNLRDNIDVIDASFEDLPFEDANFDAVWSQDAILHSSRRKKVLREVARVLKPGGHFVFTDPMQADDCPPDVLAPVLERIHLESLGSFAFYKQAAEEVGLQLVETVDMTEQLVRHYSRVAEELQDRRELLKGKVSDDYIERMLKGLGNWVEAGNKGYLAWGILHFRKPRNRKKA